MNTDELRRALHRDAELAPVPQRDLLDQVTRRRRRSNRRRVAGIAGGLALAGVLAGLPVVVDSFTGSDGTSVAQAPAVDVLAGPTRGSLASDVELVEAIRRLDWRGEANPVEAGPQPDVGARTVVFAGDVGDSRLALVSSTVNGVAHVIWFAGALGAPADQLQPLVAEKSWTPELPLAVIDLSEPNPVAVVVGAPGDDIEFSPAAQLNRDGTQTRPYQAGTEVADGIASWPTSSTGAQALTFRTSRDNIVAFRAPFDIGGSSPAQSAAPAVPTYADPRGYGQAADDRFIATMVGEVTNNLQLTVEQLNPTLLWAGTIPGPATTTNTGIVLGYTAPSGASLIQETAFVESSDGYAIIPGAWQPFPVGTPVEDRALLIGNTVNDGTLNGQLVTSLVAVGPTTATQARLISLDGAEITTVSLTNGAIAVPGQEVDAVEFLDGAGAVIATASLSPAYGTGGNGPIR